MAEHVAIRNAARVIERDVAVRMVEALLEREAQVLSTSGVEPAHVIVTDVKEHELVWIVSFQSAEYLRMWDPSFLLAGNGPYLVDRVAVPGGGVPGIRTTASAIRRAARSLCAMRTRPPACDRFVAPGTHTPPTPKRYPWTPPSVPPNRWTNPSSWR